MVRVLLSCPEGFIASRHQTRTIIMNPDFSQSVLTQHASELNPPALQRTTPTVATVSCGVGRMHWDVLGLQPSTLQTGFPDQARCKL